jgi:hypothetical protein
MNQGTQGYSLMKKTEGRKSRDTVSLKGYSEEKKFVRLYSLKLTKVHHYIFKKINSTAVKLLFV